MYQLIKVCGVVFATVLYLEAVHLVRTHFVHGPGIYLDSFLMCWPLVLIIGLALVFYNFTY